MGANYRRGRTLCKLLRDRRGTAEIVGSIMFIVILFFFFTNVYLWHDQATREMDNLVLDRVNSPVSIEIVDEESDPIILKVTNNGGVGIRLSRLWIIPSGGIPTPVNLEEFDIWVPGGASYEISRERPVEEITFKILTDLGNTASCQFSP